jgi:hypothetical protein
MNPIYQSRTRLISDPYTWQYDWNVIQRSHGYVHSNTIHPKSTRLRNSISISLTHSWSWVLLEKPPTVQPLKKFPEFYGTRRFITVFTRALHWSLSSRSEASCGVSWQAYFLRWVVSPTPNPQAGGPPLVGCPRLLVQYIRSYPPKLEGVSSIRNLRTRHAVMTRDPPNIDIYIYTY